MRSTTPIRCFMLLSTAVLLSACASAPLQKPDAALTKAEYAITQAEQAVGQSSQSVSLYEAKKRLGEARSLVAKPDATKDDYVRARRLAEEATLDARLAQTRAQAQQAQSQKADLQKSIETLREEIQGKEAE